MPQHRDVASVHGGVSEMRLIELGSEQYNPECLPKINCCQNRAALVSNCELPYLSKSNICNSTDLDNIDAERGDLWLSLWVIVEVLQLAFLCQVIYATASFSNCRKSAEICCCSFRGKRAGNVHCASPRRWRSGLQTGSPNWRSDRVAQELYPNRSLIGHYVYMLSQSTPPTAGMETFMYWQG